jgi:hypothetical protein
MKGSPDVGREFISAVVLAMGRGTKQAEAKGAAKIGKHIL